jgi:surface protein
MENIYQTSELFKNCSSIVSLDDIEKWSFKSIKYTDEMFAGCSSLETIGDISHWDVKNLVEMSRMFNGCRNLTCDLSSWTIQKHQTKVKFPFTDTNKKIFKKPNIIA